MNPRHRRLLIPGLLILLVVVVVVASLTGKADAETTEVTRVADPRITESSGLAVSVADPDLVYTINDSGSEPEIYAVSLATGETVGVTRIAGTEWFDPEALSIAPDGTLWIADTGDNGLQRKKPMLYSLPEPGTGDATVTPVVHVLAYPDGPVDVEALAIDPRGGMFLITKELLGGEVLRIPDLLSEAEPNVVEPIGVSMPSMVTDAAFTPDGSVLAVRTYTAVELYRTDRAIEHYGTLRPPAAGQGETVATEASSASALVGSEGTGQPLHRVTWDAPPAPTPARAPVSAREEPEEHTVAWAVAAAVAAVVLIGVLTLVVRRRRA